MNIRPAVASDVAALFSIRTSVQQNHMSIEELAELGITPGSLSGMLVGRKQACKTMGKFDLSNLLRLAKKRL